MPRRVAEYDPSFTTLNQVSSVGALLMGLSTLPFLINVVVSAFRGRVAGGNPWNALTPEWLTSSPPPVENWIGEAPLVTHPYGYGTAVDAIDLGKATGDQIWTDRRP
jgi:cytochrome c oxidase subunit 1